MKILVCHNYYQQPGGEDLSFASEASLLESYGHQIVRYTLHNDEIRSMRRWDVARRTIWNSVSRATLEAIIRRERPAIMHCTNTFPLISPAAYYAARKAGVPVVQSLRNYRLLCPGACFLRDGRTCQRCLGKWFAWPAVIYGCYRQHRIGSAVVAAMLGIHRSIGTWDRTVDAYIALTEFSRRKFIEGGLPAEKIFVKPNFLHPDPGPANGERDCAVFVGRLSPEKGIDTLLSAWSRVTGKTQLKIVGDGPLSRQVLEASASDGRITWLGRRRPDEVSAIMGGASFLVLPSIWYEGFPRVIVEAFARGLPVVAPRLGSMVELVKNESTGVHFHPGDPDGLAQAVMQLAGDRQRVARMAASARREYEAKYTAQANYRILSSVYEYAMGNGTRKNL
jgi:glycosyltransferase involved in cell wall biosynthesis